MGRHVIRAQRARKLNVSQDSQDLQKVHLSFIGKDLGEIVQSPADVAHVDLVYLSPPGQVFDDRKNFCSRLFQPFGGCSETQLEAVVLGSGVKTCLQG